MPRRPSRALQYPPHHLPARLCGQRTAHDPRRAAGPHPGLAAADRARVPGQCHVPRGGRSRKGVPQLVQEARTPGPKRFSPVQVHGPGARHLLQQPGHPPRGQSGVAAQLPLGTLEGREAAPREVAGAARTQDRRSALRAGLAGCGQPVDALLPVRVRAAHPPRTEDGQSRGPSERQRNHGVGRRRIRPRHP